MHKALKREFENLKTLSQEKDTPLSIIETKLDNVVFVSSGKRLVCLAVEEGKIHNMLSCFKVNINKWNWAEEEGFSLEDGLPEKLIDEILIKFNTPSEYLNYLDL